jgi:hypothetical protein
MIALINEPNGSACAKILADNRQLFQAVQGSSFNHQAWPGGYLDHVQETMNIGIVLYNQFNSLRPLPFSPSDLLLVLYLHDIEKPWKYELREDGQIRYKPNMRSKSNQRIFRLTKLLEYGIILNAEQGNGLEYAEGEKNDYSNLHRAMNPLACLAHICDVASARLWFDHPAQTNDSWNGAKRHRE